MKGVTNNKVLNVSAAAAVLAAIATFATPTNASASDFSKYIEPSASETIAFVETIPHEAADSTTAIAIEANEARLKNNAHPAATAPLPPAIMTGSGMLIGHWALRKMFKRRWI
jgi:hypothetical protein